MRRWLTLFAVVIIGFTACSPSPTVMPTLSFEQALQATQTEVINQEKLATAIEGTRAAEHTQTEVAVSATNAAIYAPTATQRALSFIASATQNRANINATATQNRANINAAATQEAAVLATLDTLSISRQGTDILFLVDVSGSMLEEKKLNFATSAIKNTLQHINPNDRLSLMTFSNDIRRHISLTHGNQAIPSFETELEKLRADGGTALYAAIISALDTLVPNSNTDRQQIIILISDGEDTASRSDTLNDVITEIQATRSKTTSLFLVPVAYGSGADVPSLLKIANASQTTVMFATPETINSVLYDVLAEIALLQ